MDRRQFMVVASLGSVMGRGALSARASEAEKPAPLKLRYAINIQTHFTSHPPIDRLKLVKEAGFTAVEFNGLPDLDRKPGSKEPNYDAIAVYGNMLENLGLSQATWVTNGCAGKCNCAVTETSGHAEFLRRVEQTSKISPLVKGTISTITSGVEAPGLSREEMTKNTIDAFKRAADIVEKAGGPMLVLEPLNVLVDHPGYHVVTSDHAAQIIDAVGSSKVKILYDIYHQQISEGNVINNIRKYYDKIGYFQFGDTPGRHEPFTGEINYPNVFKAIHALGYQGMVGGEFSPQGGGNDESTRASLDAIKRADVW